MKIGLLYGTETGNSELLCEDIEEELGQNYECEIADLADTQVSDLTSDRFYIFVTSTYGNGDLPTSATPFFDALDEQRPDLSELRFAIFGLGDMVFDATFNQGSERLKDLLIECNAKMLGERGIYDASSAEMPEDVALPWVRTILPQIAIEVA